MSVEKLAEQLREKVTQLGFKGAKFQYALVKELGTWKIFLMRIVFDYSAGDSRVSTFIEEENFILEDYSVGIDEFYKLIDSLRQVDVEQHGNRDVPIGLNRHHLHFRGNYPGGGMVFLTSQQGVQHGLKHAFYYIQYNLDSSARAHTYDIALTHHELPFRNVVEAINHLWHTEFDASMIHSQPTTFYLPLLDASIKTCKQNGGKIRIELDIDHSRVSINGLSVAVIARAADREYRKRHAVPADSMEINVDFWPESYSVTLNRGAQKLDEHLYYKESASPIIQEVVVSEIMPQSQIHVIYVDAGYNPRKGGLIAWFNETTGETFYKPESCKDSFRCEYAAIIHTLENFKGFNPGDEVEIMNDSDTVVDQLNRVNAINHEDIRQLAMNVWNIVARKFHGKVKFIWIPRARNKAGKLLGS